MYKVNWCSSRNHNETQIMIRSCIIIIFVIINIIIIIIITNRIEKLSSRQDGVLASDPSTGYDGRASRILGGTFFAVAFDWKSGVDCPELSNHALNVPTGLPGPTTDNWWELFPDISLMLGALPWRLRAFNWRWPDDESSEPPDLLSRPLVSEKKNVGDLLFFFFFHF